MASTSTSIQGPVSRPRSLASQRSVFPSLREPKNKIARHPRVVASCRGFASCPTLRSSDDTRNQPSAASKDKSDNTGTAGDTSSEAVESAIEAARKEFETAKIAAAEQAKQAAAEQAATEQASATSDSLAQANDVSYSDKAPTLTKETSTQENVSASNATDDDPFTEAADAPSKSQTSPASEQASKLWERVRSAQSSLPAFDGLTSSASLSSILSTASSRTRDLATTLRAKISTLSAQYNTFSGYSAIEDLKIRITTLETSLEAARTVAASAKKAYLSSVQSRSSSQRETNDLLSRKNSWTEADLSRYTELLRKEHALSRQEAEAEKELERTEAQVQEAFDELMKAVMMRYHEEQIWSDRMRGMSTYGSLIVAGLNAFLFILAILLVEPYKRKRLAQTFEERLVRAEEQSRELILASVEKFQSSLDGALAQKASQAEKDGPSQPLTTPQPTLVEVQEQAAPIVEDGEVQTEVVVARKRGEEERIVFASTVGVVVGAALSLLISTCWS